MKIIITGGTRFIGAATLAKLLEHPSVTKVVAYTRRPLSTKHSKLENIVQDHLDIPKNDSALIWCAGIKLGISPEDARALEEAAISAAGKHSRFVFLSGMLAVQDQSTSLWFANDARKLKGHSESRLKWFRTLHRQAVDVCQRLKHTYDYPYR